MQPLTARQQGILRLYQEKTSLTLDAISSYQIKMSELQVLLDAGLIEVVACYQITNKGREAIKP